MSPSVQKKNNPGSDDSPIANKFSGRPSIIVRGMIGLRLFVHSLLIYLILLVKLLRPDIDVVREIEDEEQRVKCLKIS